MFVLGNGESRRTVDLAALPKPLVGCNAVCRDIQVEHLICVDRKMVAEAINNKLYQAKNIYTRYEWYQHLKKHKNLFPVPDLPYVGDQRPDQPFHWGSGPYAVLIASKLSSQVSLIGFDLYGLDNNLINNIYKDTINYDKSEKRFVDPRYWIHQIAKVFESYPQNNYTVYQLDDWILPESWNYPNVSLDSIRNL